jgi:hypothetical protein
MKNLMVFVSPEKKFNDENKVYVEIQIENSLNYWKKEDIMLVTNFPYEYMGVKALVVPDTLFSSVSRCAIKINVICYLLENGLINELTWFHDTEAWQLAPLDLKLDKELGLTDYGWSSKWNGGSMFFEPTTLDIFRLWKKAIEERKEDDERALMYLTKNNICEINSRIQRLNITYNLGKRRVDENLMWAEEPIRVAHFHPYRENLLSKFATLLPTNLYKLMYEKNPNIGNERVHRK